MTTPKRGGLCHVFTLHSGELSASGTESGCIPRPGEIRSILIILWQETS
jgi:hypothetical protein